jgi:hypothetical protein
MRWNVAPMVEKKNSYKILVGRRKRRVHSEDLGIDGRIIFK